MCKLRRLAVTQNCGSWRYELHRKSESSFRGLHWKCKWATTWQNQQSDCAPSEDSDQPGHPPSLIRVLPVRMKKAWVLSYPLSAQRRLWSDWADAQAHLSLRWVHSHFVGFVMSRLKYCGVVPGFFVITKEFYIWLHTVAALYLRVDFALLWCFDETPIIQTLNRLTVRIGVVLSTHPIKLAAFKVNSDTSHRYHVQNICLQYSYFWTLFALRILWPFFIALTAFWKHGKCICLHKKKLIWATPWENLSVPNVNNKDTYQPAHAHYGQCLSCLLPG